jgi:hypothetical protein
MTQTTVTYADAPRDLDGILKIGRFQMRLLGEDIPAYSNGDEKQAFLKMDSSGQAAAIFKAIQERDKREKGGSVAKTTTKPAVSRTPSNKGAAKENVEAPAAGNVQGGGDVGGNTAALFALLKEIKDGQAALEEKVDALAEGQGIIQGQIAGNNRLVSVGISLALQMSEQTLNAPAEAVLTMAIEQLPSIEGTLNELVGGEGGEDEGDSGNE